MHLSYMHPMTSENQFHCTRLYGMSISHWASPKTINHLPSCKTAAMDKVGMLVTEIQGNVYPELICYNWTGVVPRHFADASRWEGGGKFHNHLSLSHKFTSAFTLFFLLLSVTLKKWTAKESSVISESTIYYKNITRGIFHSNSTHALTPWNIRHAYCIAQSYNSHQLPRQRSEGSSPKQGDKQISGIVSLQYQANLCWVGASPCPWSCLFSVLSSLWLPFSSIVQECAVMWMGQEQCSNRTEKIFLRPLPSERARLMSGI